MFELLGKISSLIVNIDKEGPRTSITIIDDHNDGLPW